MIRSELCAIAGMRVADFNARLRSGEVPFEPRLSGEIRDPQGRIWSNFSIDQAAYLLAAQQLASAGLSWSEAAAILREPPVPVPRRASLQAGSYCVARVEFMREGGGEPNYRPRFTVYGGPLSDIVTAAQAEIEQYNRQSAHNPFQRISFTSLVAADLARARRVATARAEEMGLVGDQVLRVDPEADELTTSEDQA